VLGCNTTPSADEPSVLLPESPDKRLGKITGHFDRGEQTSSLLDSAAAISQSQNESLDPDWIGWRSCWVHWLKRGWYVLGQPTEEVL
jgi:hypothetical protein